MHKALIVALLLLPAASAFEESDLDFSQSYVARAAIGDIPSTNETEPAGQINIVEYLRFDHPTDADSGTSLIAFGGGQDRIGCTCGAFSVQDNNALVHDTTAAGEYVLVVVRSAPVADAFVLDLPMFGGGVAADAQINVYLPNTHEVTAPVAGAVLPCTAGPCTIHSFTGRSGAALPSDFWIAAHPKTGASPGTVTVTEPAGFGYLELVIGVLAGALIWFWLVQKGFVQVRSRKQKHTKSLHEEVAESESAEVLAARKRVLMAGLKDLELAKMKKEVDDATYDQLKAELKREAVTAMRALEAQSKS